MKAHSTSVIAGLLFAGAAAFATDSSTSPGPEAILSLEAKPDSTVSLTISNSGNQVWLIQSSTNLVNWSEIEALKVHNGEFHRSYAGAGSAMQFFRAFYDSTRQDILSTTANALLL